MKLLVSDFDNTLYNDDYLENIRLINEFVLKGNLFVIATGRSLFNLKKGIDNYHIPYSYLICNDGATIFDQNNKVIMENVISKKIVAKVFNKLKTYNLDEVLVVNENEFSSNLTGKVFSVIAKFSDKEEAFKIISDIEKDIPEVQGYLSTNWINIISINQTKGNAIKYLQKKLNIDNKDIYTIGDAVNDIPMNKLYNGYAINSNCEELIKVSNGELTSFKQIFEKILEDN